MYCYKCGKKVDGKDKYCRFCGAYLNKSKGKQKAKNKPEKVVAKQVEIEQKKSAIIKPIEIDSKNKPKDIIKPAEHVDNDGLRNIVITPFEPESKPKELEINPKPEKTNSKLGFLKVNSPEFEDDKKDRGESRERTSFLVEIILLVVIFGIVIALVIFNGGKNKVYCVVNDSDGKKIKDMEYYLYAGNSKVSLYIERIYTYYNSEDDAQEYYDKRKNDCLNKDSDLELCYYNVNGNMVIKTIEKDFLSYQKEKCEGKDFTQKKDCEKNNTQCLNTNCVRYNNKEVITLAEQVLTSGNNDITVKCK